MIAKKELLQLLFIDIETVPEYSTHEEFTDKNPALAQLFLEKMVKAKKLDDCAKFDEYEVVYRNNASLYPEFSKILSISFGTIKEDGEKFSFFIKNFTGHNEAEVLTSFKKMLGMITVKQPKFKFCGHNINGFDLPFIIKRMMIKGVSVPIKLKFFDVKPWDFPTLDTMLIWKNGCFENTGLETVCIVLGIESPKNSGVTNSGVADMYYSDAENSLTAIREYCNHDVRAVMEIMLKFYGGYDVS